MCHLFFEVLYYLKYFFFLPVNKEDTFILQKRWMVKWLFQGHKGPGEYVDKFSDIP